MKTHHLSIYVLSLRIYRIASRLAVYVHMKNSFCIREEVKEAHINYCFAIDPLRKIGFILWKYVSPWRIHTQENNSLTGSQAFSAAPSSLVLSVSWIGYYPLCWRWWLSSPRLLTTLLFNKLFFPIFSSPLWQLSMNTLLEVEKDCCCDWWKIACLEH